MNRTRQDPQDKAFGASVAEDQDVIDELEDEGVEEKQLPDSVGDAPRAAGKAEPDTD